VLKWYHADFDTSFKFKEYIFETPPRVFVNFVVDRICLQNGLANEKTRYAAWRDFSELCNYAATQGPRSVAFNVELYLEDQDFDISRMLPEAGDSSLEEIILFRYHEA
jgi:hypothetical protein